MLANNAAPEPSVSCLPEQFRHGVERDRHRGRRDHLTFADVRIADHHRHVAANERVGDPRREHHRLLAVRIELEAAAFGHRDEPTHMRRRSRRGVAQTLQRFVEAFRSAVARAPSAAAAAALSFLQLSHLGGGLFLALRVHADLRREPGKHCFAVGAKATVHDAEPGEAAAEPLRVVLRDAGVVGPLLDDQLRVKLTTALGLS